ncbi:MAG: toll/interleukin-1 receptor domain-containing protein [Lachnospiraceae bacterium]|nr:toll/interleukin-1 receptor domain-containing protein [Lachnospiraceae bacterium]
MQIFISHSSKNAAAATEICRLLEERGTKCFIAPRDIRTGREYAEEIVNGLDASSAVILLMSKEANHSPHVLREVERAVSKSIPILVYKLEEVALSKSMEYFLMTHQWVGLQDKDSYERILSFAADLQQQTTKEPGAQVQAAGRQSAQAQKAGKRQNSKKTVLAALLFCVLVIGIIAGSFLFRGSGQEKRKAQVQVGDTVTFGSYNGEEINWRVLKISEDGSQAVLVAADILTMKAFDAAEGGRYNWYESTDYWSQNSAADTDFELQILVRGNNDWSVSNIRTWLNSANEVVVYADQPPEGSAMAEKKNGYQNEAGFLHDFTAEEIAAIVETEIVTNSNVLYDADTVTSMDRVYLLSMEELQWFDEAGISKLAVPTQAAVEQDGSCWYMLDYTEYNIKEYCWWLREPVADTASRCYLVGNGYTQENIRRENAGLEGYGVRPALTVDLYKVSFRNEEE